MIDDRKKTIAQACIDFICWHYGVDQADLLGKDRKRPIVFYRQELMTLLSLAGYSFPKAGKIVGGRDHTTALHAFKAVEKRTPDKMVWLRAHATRLKDGRELGAVENLAESPDPFSTHRLIELTFAQCADLKKKNAELEAENLELRQRLKLADNAYGVVRLHDRIEQLEAELAHERENCAPKKPVSRFRELVA